MFKDILVPIDFSAHSSVALAHATAVARAFNSRLVLLHVVDFDRGANNTYSVNPLDWQLRKAEAKAYLQDRVQQLQPSGVDAEWYVLEGDTAKSIIGFAQNHPVDLVVMNARGQNADKEWNLGNVVQKVAQHVRKSVLLVRSESIPSAHPTVPEEVSYRRVLVPLDCSQRAECVLSSVATLSMKHDGQVILIHIVRQPEIPRRMPLTQEEGQLVDSIVQRNQLEAERYLAELGGRMQGHIETRVLVGAHVGSILQQLTVQEHIDLVVLSAHGYSSETTWSFGSLAAHFLTYGNTSVLIVQDTPA